MYALDGFNKNIANIYKISAPFAAGRIITAEDLRAPYRSFIKKFHGEPAINESADLIVQDATLTRKLLARIAGSRLNDLDQEKMVDDTLDSNDIAARTCDIEDALDFIAARRPEQYNLLRTAVHSIAISRSLRNRHGQRAHGGTSNGLIGLIWFALEERLLQVDLVEMLVHELTHTLVFIDELNHGHFNYQTLTLSDYWAQSAILSRPRPMDKVVHSIVVSTEVLQARKNYIGEIHQRRVHPDTPRLRAQTHAAIDSVLHHPRVEEVCLPRAIELVHGCRELLEVH